MLPETWVFRHDEIITGRPFAVDVDEEDWLWQGCGANRLVGHNLRTAQVRVISVPEMGGRVIFQVFAWEGKLLMVLGSAPFYLVYDKATGTCIRREIPAERPIVWYGATAPNGKRLLFERSESKVLVLDAPDAEPRIVPCPYEGQLAGGTPCSDGLIYGSLVDPGRLVRFDPESERFVGEWHAPFPEAGISGRFDHKGILYGADSAGGRILPVELATGRWLDPIPTPDHGEVYGFIGGGFSFQGKGYWCLSTYPHQSRLDAKTGKIIIPDGRLSIDDRPPRFIEKHLVFDPETRAFTYLEAPAQPDGVALLCYNWTDGERFVITGIVIQSEKPGVPGEQQLGPWLVLQSQPVAEEPGFGMHDLNWNRQAHLRAYRRGYSARHSLFLPEDPWTPPITNPSGPATQYPAGKAADLARRAARTDPDAYWRSLAEALVAGIDTPAEQAKAIAAFVHRQTYYNPIQVVTVQDPIAILEGHDARCGHGVNISLALLNVVGIECRSVQVRHHVVGEAFYDGGWHMVDAMFFGGNQPQRDGRVLSVAELRADPYFADAFPTECFAYDPELLLSEDGYNVLGYVFGPWGSEPYYSYYHYGEKELPPTLPTALPAQRLGESAVRLRWSESIKAGGGEIEYLVRVFADRACTQEVFRASTCQASTVFEVPEGNRMYFVGVQAMDDHRCRNPNTWYPMARGNFVHVPPDQYGWYGVL